MRPFGARQQCMLDWFCLYGWPVLSSIRLPFEPLATPPAGDPTWTFEAVGLDGMPAEEDAPIVSETRCFAPCHAGRIANRVRRGPRGTWVWDDRIGRIHVTPDGRR